MSDKLGSSVVVKYVLVYAAYDEYDICGVVDTEPEAQAWAALRPDIRSYEACAIGQIKESRLEKALLEWRP